MMNAQPQLYTQDPSPLCSNEWSKVDLFTSENVHNVRLVKVKPGSDTVIHTPQLKDSLHLN